jgi:hypothetical protein
LKLKVCDEELQKHVEEVAEVVVVVVEEDSIDLHTWQNSEMY